MVETLAVAQDFRRPQK